MRAFPVIHKRAQTVPPPPPSPRLPPHLFKPRNGTCALSNSQDVSLDAKPAEKHSSTASVTSTSAVGLTPTPAASHSRSSYLRPSLNPAVDFEYDVLPPEHDFVPALPHSSPVPEEVVVSPTGDGAAKSDNSVGSPLLRPAVNTAPPRGSIRQVVVGGTPKHVDAEST